MDTYPQWLFTSKLSYKTGFAQKPGATEPEIHFQQERTPMLAPNENCSLQSGQKYYIYRLETLVQQEQKRKYDSLK